MLGVAIAEQVEQDLPEGPIHVVMALDLVICPHRRERVVGNTRVVPGTLQAAEGLGSLFEMCMIQEALEMPAAIAKGFWASALVLLSSKIDV